MRSCVQVVCRPEDKRFDKILENYGTLVQKKFSECSRHEESSYSFGERERGDQSPLTLRERWGAWASGRGGKCVE